MTLSPPAAEPQPRRLLDQVRDKRRSRTEDADTGWIKRFIWFHTTCYPRDMSPREVGLGRNP